MSIIRPDSRQPIPLHATEVYKGKIFSVFQWEQEMFDGSREIFEKIKRTDTVMVFPIMPDGRIIISEQEQPGMEPFLGCIGGRVDSGETPEEAVKRELLEETGLVASEIILWDSVQLSTKIDWAIYTFVSKNCFKVKDQSPDSGEKIKLKYVSFDELLEIARSDNFREIEVILKLFKQEGNREEFEKTKQLFGVR